VNVVDLTCETAQQFICEQPVSAILYFTPHDRGIEAVLTRLAAIAESFDELARFGKVDVAAPENVELLRDQIVVATPTLIYYRFGVPRGEDVGCVEILKWLDHASIVHFHGHTDTWLRLIR
jgi:hypothetical protein